MNLTSKERIQILCTLGKRLAAMDESYQEAREKAFHENQWFIPENIDKAILAIVDAFLQPELLESWLDQYPRVDVPKKVGIIMAGNIPFVGFHDFLAVFTVGHKAMIKLSSKDEVLMKFIFRTLVEIDSRTEPYFELVERLVNFDAVIATGSNNSSRYFEYYFGKYPNIIRKNRNGLAVLKGDESEDDLRKLSDDVFDYFGLGCRNVTKVYVPEEYDFGTMLKIFEEKASLSQHNKYRNNYDYNYAIYLLNREEILISENLILKEDTSYLSRIACLHFERYEEISLLKEQLEMENDLIQCVASCDGQLLKMSNEVAFGQTQSPKLMDYADGVDTMFFLTNLA